MPPVKWSKKEAIRHLQELRNPFEQAIKGQGETQTPVGGTSDAEKIKEIAKRGQGTRPL